MCMDAYVRPDSGNDLGWNVAYVDQMSRARGERSREIER